MLLPSGGAASLAGSGSRVHQRCGFARWRTDPRWGSRWTDQRRVAVPITQRFVMSHLPGAKHLVPGRTCPRPNPAMGSFGFWEMPQCSGNGCQRWCTCIADDFGPICSVCQQYYVNKCKLQCLQNLIPQLRALMHPTLLVLVMDFLCGDGREDDCECEQCERHWFDQGWICPGEWMRH